MKDDERVMDEPLSDDRLAAIRGAMEGHYAIYESDLPLFSDARALLDEVDRLRAEHDATHAALVALLDALTGDDAVRREAIDAACRVAGHVPRWRR